MSVSSEYLLLSTSMRFHPQLHFDDALLFFLQYGFIIFALTLTLGMRFCASPNESVFPISSSLWRRTQVIQSDLRILPETIESDIGLHRNPISSGKHQSDLTRFSSDSFRMDSGSEYIGKDPIETSRKQLKDPLTLTKIRRSENRGKHKIRRHSVRFQQTLISDFELQQPE